MFSLNYLNYSAKAVNEGMDLLLESEWEHNIPPYYAKFSIFDYFGLQLLKKQQVQEGHSDPPLSP